MVSNFRSLFRLSPNPGLAILALAATVGFISTAAAGPVEVAVVESSNSGAVQFMDFVTAGQVIRLDRHETIALSYMRSCMQETITGGTVIVGMDRSEVIAGQVLRLSEPCAQGTVVLTNTLVGAGGRAFRGPPDHR
jgi:hypothetical protein